MGKPTARGLPHVFFMGYPSRSIPTGGWWDETPPLCRNQLQATKTAQKRADSHRARPGALCRVSGALSRCTSGTLC